MCNFLRHFSCVHIPKSLYNIRDVAQEYWEKGVMGWVQGVFSASTMYGLLQVVQDGFDFVREARSAGRRERTGVLFIATCPLFGTRESIGMKLIY